MFCESLNACTVQQWKMLLRSTVIAMVAASGVDLSRKAGHFSSEGPHGGQMYGHIRLEHKS